MVTLKFEAEKLCNEILVLPTVLITTHNGEDSFNINLGWFKSALTISVNWNSKAVKVQAQ